VNIGQTVFYRLSAEDAEKVNKRREDAEFFHRKLSEAAEYKGGAFSAHTIEGLVPLLGSGYQQHHGLPVTEEMLLPAEVVICYTAAEKGYVGDGRDTPIPLDEEEAKKQLSQDFSGMAALRVSLPGNDVLFVPEAVEDINPEIERGRGCGITAMPKPGMFTTAVPADLLS
jgi:hypothetical protein